MKARLKKSFPLILFPSLVPHKGMSLQKTPQKRQYRSCIPAAALIVLPVMAAFAVLPPAAPAQSTLPAGEKNIARATLDNGLQVVVVRNTLSPVATTVISYKAGASESPAGFPGTAHALEHMMFRGSPGLSAGQLAHITAALGGMFNALTRQSATQYFFTVPAADLEIALQIEALRMQGVLGREEAWDQERGAMLQEVARNHSMPEYMLYTRLREALFKGTPYERDALGTRASLEETTVGMLGRFHKAWYGPNNAVLVVAGDVDPQDTLEKIGRLFGGIPARDIPGRPGVDLKPVERQTIRLKTDKPYGSVVMAVRMPGYSSPDYAAARVLSDILNNPRGVLYALVPQGKALDTGFQMDTYPEAGMGYAVALFPQGSDPQNLERELKEVLSRLARDGVSEEMVTTAKRRTMTSVELEKNSVTGLAMAWSTALAVEGRTSPEEILYAIEKVTARDVNRLARACLDLESSVTGILVPEPSGGPAPSPDSFGGPESFTPESVETVALPPWAEKTLERLSVPESTVSPVVSTLSNGIQLIVQPVSVSETVSVYGHVKNTPELQVPKGREGVNEVLDNLFSYGTTSLGREEFQQALDEIGAFVTPGADFTIPISSRPYQWAVRHPGCGLHPSGAGRICRPGDGAPCRQHTQAGPAGRGVSDGAPPGRGHCGWAPEKPRIPHGARRSEGDLSRERPDAQAGHAGDSDLAEPERREGLLPQCLPARHDHHRGHRPHCARDGPDARREAFRRLERPAGPQTGRAPAPSSAQRSVSHPRAQ